MKKIFVIGLLASSFFLSSCASIYEEMINNFSITQLNQDTYKIRLGFFVDKAYIDDAYDFALFKAAKITLKQNKKFFLLKNEEKVENKQTSYVPTHYIPAQTYWGRGFRGRWYSYAPTIHSGYYVNTDHATISLTIVTLNSSDEVKPEGNQIVCDATMIFKDVAEKYNLKEKR